MEFHRKRRPAVTEAVQRIYEHGFLLEQEALVSTARSPGALPPPVVKRRHISFVAPPDRS